MSGQTDRHTRLNTMDPTKLRDYPQLEKCSFRDIQRYMGGQTDGLVVVGDEHASHQINTCSKIDHLKCPILRH